MITSSWFGTFTQINQSWNSTSTQQQWRLSAGLLTRMVSWRQVVVLLIAISASGTLTRFSRCMQLTLGLKCAIWCSQRRHTRSWAPTDTLWTRSCSGSTQACKRFRRWLATLSAFFTSQSALVDRTSSLGPVMRLCAFGMFSRPSVEACSILNSPSSSPPVLTCAEQRRVRLNLR